VESKAYIANLYLLSQDYKITEQRIKRGDASAGGKGAGAP
jgi:hypothetical protein